MCIIVAKKQGLDIPSKEILKSCNTWNNDGAGFMYVNNNNKIQIEKGFMNFESFYNRLMEVDNEYNLKEKGLVMHFRITSVGVTTPENCHPFPISTKISDLKSLNMETSNVAMAHNGTISLYKEGTNKTLSDTQNFIKDFIYHIYKTNKTFYKDKYIMDMIAKVGGSRFCFLDKNEGIYHTGEGWIEDQGILYSNSTYSWGGDSSYDNVYNLLYYAELEAFMETVRDEYLMLDSSYTVEYSNGIQETYTDDEDFCLYYELGNVYLMEINKVDYTVDDVMGDVNIVAVYKDGVQIDVKQKLKDKGVIIYE